MPEQEDNPGPVFGTVAHVREMFSLLDPEEFPPDEESQDKPGAPAVNHRVEFRVEPELDFSEDAV